MRIAIIGSAPSSIRKAPYSDPSWKVWGCSPGAYAVVGRSDVWFEIHRFEPPVIGKPDQQRPWFSPEYVMWLAQHPKVVMLNKEPMIPNSIALPVDDLIARYGHYNFTSSIAWMMAMAIDEIQEARQFRPQGLKQVDEIGLWGVDMSATEEYGYQRSGCQFFVQLASALRIKINLPPESDLMVPPPLYGVSEINHVNIKMLERKREIEGRLANAHATLANAQNETMFLKGALDDINYVLNTWTHQGDAMAANFPQIFESSPPSLTESSSPPSSPGAGLAATVEGILDCRVMPSPTMQTSSSDIAELQAKLQATGRASVLTLGSTADRMGGGPIQLLT
jgi:hypothetical protein